MPTPIRTIEAYLASKESPKMTDKQTLKWWIDHANELELKLKALQEYSELREQRIQNILLERNEALRNAEQWKMKYWDAQYANTVLRMNAEPPTDYVPTEAPPIIFRDQWFNP